MKTLSIYSKNKVLTNHDVENMIEIEHVKIKADAYNDGKHSGMNDQPPAKGDKLIHYIESYKTRYEQLVSKVLQVYQPALQLPAGKMENDRATVTKKKLNDEIGKIKIEIGNLHRELGNYDPSGLTSRIRKANLISVGLFVTDIVVNTQAFEVSGDNYLLCVLLSASVSFAICLGAHFTGKKYQSAQSKIRKLIILAIGGIFISAFSFAIASFRASLYRKTGVDINPNLFTIFNIGFFFIAAYATAHYHPTKEEIEENREHLDRYKKIQKLTKQMEQKEMELKQYSHESDEKIQGHLQGLIQPEYLIERIKLMYMESVNEFKRANRLARKEIPDCFNDEIPPLDIPHVTLHNIIHKYKNHENENDTNNSDYTA